MMGTARRKRKAGPERPAQKGTETDGHFLRPEAAVLADEALVPSANLIAPAPNQFSHELLRAQPFYYGSARQGKAPDGILPAGTKVVLMAWDRGARCRVIDGQGLYVEVEYSSLRKL